MDSCFTESFKDLEDHRRTNKGNFRHSLQVTRNYITDYQRSIMRI